MQLLLNDCNRQWEMFNGDGYERIDRWGEDYKRIDRWPSVLLVRRGLVSIHLLSLGLADEEVLCGCSLPVEATVVYLLGLLYWRGNL